MLRGDRTADPPVWAAFGEHRAPIVWPPGYTAAFDPDLIVIAPDGRIIAHDGDSLEDGPRNDWPGLFICAGWGEVWIWEDPAG